MVDQDGGDVDAILLRAQVQRRQPVLGAVVGVGLVVDEQCRHVRVALLRAQVQRREAGLRLRVGFGAVLEQRRGDVHLNQNNRMRAD